MHPEETPAPFSQPDNGDPGSLCSLGLSRPPFCLSKTFLHNFVCSSYLYAAFLLRDWSILQAADPPDHRCFFSAILHMTPRTPNTHLARARPLCPRSLLVPVPGPQFPPFSTASSLS